MSYLAVLFSAAPDGQGNTWANVPVKVYPLDLEAVRQIERGTAQAQGWNGAVLVNLIPLQGGGQ